ncbi:uncharacterized protein F4812DRAFT_459620 [Daldinia caldariorum]|uniref:uncharacterized protein n=1 Tax=Daldinia caldariorum TaxID=326644 RepID=UPI002007D979|nr:uncharacterized protein F4812DRAFT_459620 [Daldinia caldariorum]KAI1467515.1 hypothetical protein F4812DRAFT_459620 [Daldinia caldariorum]
MNETDLFISKGTCFFGPGQVADPKYLPCGNSELLGPQPCCYAGDFCMSSTACFDSDTVVTYLAGCTDSTFTSAKCTNKYAYPDQQYVAIARCEGSQVDIWSGCAKHPDWVAIQKEPDCACTASKALIRNPNGKSSLDEIARLPTAGSTISFNPTAVPTLTSTSTSTSTSATASRQDADAAPTSSSSSSISNPPRDQSSDTKVIVGVTVGVGVPLLAALIFLSFLFLRRKKLSSATATAPTSSSQSPPPPDTKASPAHPSQQAFATAQGIHDEQLSPAGIEPTHSSPSPPPPQHTSAWYGGYNSKPELEANSAQKPELAGDEPGAFTTSSWTSGTLDSRQISELSGHDAVTGASREKYNQE